MSGRRGHRIRAVREGLALAAAHDSARAAAALAALREIQKGPAGVPLQLQLPRLPDEALTEAVVRLLGDEAIAGAAS